MDQGEQNRFSSDWDAFTRKLQAMTPQQRRTFQGEAMTSGRLSMIVALVAEWRASYTAHDTALRFRAAQRRIAEERRLARVPGTKRSYVDAATRAMMPAPKLHRAPQAERSRNRTLAYNFFHRRGGWWIARVQREASGSYQAWRAANPFGPPPTFEEQLQLQRVHAALRGKERRKGAQRFTPVGMSEDRALEIAMAALEQR